MMIRNFVLNITPGGQIHPLRIRPVLLGAVLAIYAITGAISTARAQDSRQCNMESARLEMLQQASQGFFKALRLADKPYYTGHLTFQDEQGRDVKLAAFQGKTLLVNFWAVWCGPCRAEMPELAGLKRKLGGAGFDVLAINVDRNSDEKVRNFLEEVNAGNLVFYRDKTMEIFQAVRREGLGLGLPVTLVIDPRGCLLASFNGSAPWADQDAVAFVQAVMKNSR